MLNISVLCFDFSVFLFFFFNDTATTEIYTLSLHYALPISRSSSPSSCGSAAAATPRTGPSCSVSRRSEEHTSELQSRQYLVCRLLLDKKKNNNHQATLPAPKKEITS